MIVGWCAWEHAVAVTRRTTSPTTTAVAKTARLAAERGWLIGMALHAPRLTMSRPPVDESFSFRSSHGTIYSTMFAAVVTLIAVAGDPGSLHPELNPAAVAAIGPLVGHCGKDPDSRESVRQPFPVPAVLEKRTSTRTLPVETPLHQDLTDRPHVAPYCVATLRLL